MCRARSNPHRLLCSDGRRVGGGALETRRRSAPTWLWGSASGLCRFHTFACVAGLWPLIGVCNTENAFASGLQLANPLRRPEVQRRMASDGPPVCHSPICVCGPRYSRLRPCGWLPALRESAQGSCALPCVKTCADVAAVRLSRSALRTLPCAWLRIAVANTAVAKTSLCCPWAPPCMGDSELADCLTEWAVTLCWSSHSRSRARITASRARQARPTSHTPCQRSSRTGPRPAALARSKPNASSASPPPSRRRYDPLGSYISRCIFICIFVSISIYLYIYIHTSR